MTTTHSARHRGAVPTATTARDLLERAHTLTVQYLDTHDTIPLARWESFDQTLYRLVVELLTRRTIGPGAVDRAALPLHDILKTYPTPLAALPGGVDLTVPQVARLTGYGPRAIRAKIMRGQIPATRTPTGWMIPPRSLDLRGDVHPADATDPHPLARLAVTLGALADVLHEHQQGTDRPDLGTGPLLRLAHDVLHDANLVARHTLTLIEPDGISRVTAIALRVATATTRLNHATNNPIPYAALPPPISERVVPARPGSPGPELASSLPGLLDRAIADWTRAARTELAHSVPSIDVIRNITSQGVHLYAATDALLAAGPPTPAKHAGDEMRGRLRAAAGILQQAGTAWGPATTVVPPSPAYVDAAQYLHDALDRTIDTARHLGAPELSTSRERVLDSLIAANQDLAALTRRIRPIPAQLIDAGVLFGHARAVDATTDRLHARITGRLVPLDHFDLKDLTTAVTAAETAATSAARDLSMHVTMRRQPVPSTEPVLGPQL